MIDFYACPKCEHKFAFISDEFTEKGNWAYLTWRLDNLIHNLSHWFPNAEIVGVKYEK